MKNKEGGRKNQERRTKNKEGSTKNEGRRTKAIDISCLTPDAVAEASSFNRYGMQACRYGTRPSCRRIVRGGRRSITWYREHSQYNDFPSLWNHSTLWYPSLWNWHRQVARTRIFGARCSFAQECQQKGRGQLPSADLRSGAIIRPEIELLLSWWRNAGFRIKDCCVEKRTQGGSSTPSVPSGTVADIQLD